MLVWARRALSPGRVRLGRVVLVTACLVVPTTLFATVRSQAISDGTTTTTAGHPQWAASGLLITTVVPDRSLLSAGDRVTAVDGKPVASLIQPAGGGLRAGAVLTYDVRTAHGDRLEVPVLLRHYDVVKSVGRNWPLVPLVALLDLVAALVFLRRPHEPSAWSILLLAVLVPLTAFEWPAAPQVVDLIGGQGAWPYLIGDAASAMTWATLLAFALVFPRPWGVVRAQPWLVALVVALGGLVPYLVALPGILSDSDPASRLAGEVYVSGWYARAYPVAIVVALVVGYWRAAEGAERRGMRWVLAGFGQALIGYLVLFQVPLSLTGRTLVPSELEALLLAPIPLSVGAGILRYRLIDVGIILRRSLVRVGTSVVAIVVVVGAMFALSRVVHTELVVFAAGGLVAMTAYALRSRVQPLVVRRYFGDRDDPYRVVSLIGAVDTSAPAKQVLTEAAEILCRALRLVHTSIDVTAGPGELERVVAIGIPSGHHVQLELRHGSDVVGRVALDPGPDREEFGGEDDRLLGDLGRHLGSVVRAVRLNLDLQRAREDLIRGREEERRRIRRDLHDGLGPTLAATAMQAEAARTLIRDRPAEAEEILDLVQISAQAAIADIRRLVDDLRPPALDELGLPAAVHERVVSFNRRGRDGELEFAVTVEQSGDFSALPAAVEVTAYRIAIEAVTNAVRHACAHRCEVIIQRGALPEVRPGSDLLVIEVRDDGTGVAEDFSPHVGLHSMRERAEGLGGTCLITNNPQGGTIVRAVIPTLGPTLSAEAPT